MTLPPEHISVKRRRQEEPVETLYLQSADHRNKRRFTDFVFQRIKADANHATVSTPRETARAVSSFSPTGIPLVRATSPGAEYRDQQQRIRVHQTNQREQFEKSKSAVANEPDAALTQPFLGDSSPAANRTPPILPKRRFHLTKSIDPLSSKLGSGAHKNNPGRKRQNIATFVEILDSLTGPESTRAPNKIPVGDNDTDKIVGALPKTIDTSKRSAGVRKKPRASAAEKQWRVEHKNVPISRESDRSGAQRISESVHEDPSRWNYDSDQLARELEQATLEMMAESSSVRDSQLPTGLPQPDKWKSHKVPNLDDDDMEFVYDTYIRQPVATHSPDRSIQDYGVIIIGEEDQDLWQTYAEDEETEWDEEDADSNAEDNPANDYPEDELASDDEYDNDPYRYRHGASDDEEFDIDETAWSDENG